jgi:isoprenylcysteine carboxyl methyltransferase (ICMT) family protein YpbQ
MLYYPTITHCVKDTTTCTSLFRVVGDSIFGLDKNIKDSVDKAEQFPENREWYLVIGFFNLFTFLFILNILRKIFIRPSDTQQTSMLFKTIIVLTVFLSYLFISMIYTYWTTSVLVIPGSGVYYLFKFIVQMLTGVYYAG